AVQRAAAGPGGRPGMSCSEAAPLHGRHDMNFGGRPLRLSHLDRVLWPVTGFAKRDMLSYYETVAPALLPHLADRPLTLGRFPEGVHGPGWAQTECRGRPPWMRTTPLLLRDGTVRNHCVAKDLPSLLWMANQGAIELHTYPVLAGDPEE